MIPFVEKIIIRKHLCALSVPVVTFPQETEPRELGKAGLGQVQGEGGISAFSRCSGSKGQLQPGVGGRGRGGRVCLRHRRDRKSGADSAEIWDRCSSARELRGQAPATLTPQP